MYRKCNPDYELTIDGGVQLPRNLCYRAVFKVVGGFVSRAASEIEICVSRLFSFWFSLALSTNLPLVFEVDLQEIQSINRITKASLTLEL